MRRIVGMFLVLLFWLGPLAAILPVNAELRLPACCRRLGAHHCTMSAQAVSGSTPVFSASLHCPNFPEGMNCGFYGKFAGVAGLRSLASRESHHGPHESTPHPRESWASSL
jgi:hypothetical protein